MSHLPGFVTSCDRALFLSLNHLARSAAMDWLMPRATDLGLGHVQAIAVLSVAAVHAMRTRRLAWKPALLQGSIAGALVGLTLALVRLAFASGRADGPGQTAGLFAAGFGVVLWGRFAAPAARSERRWVGPLLVAFALSGLSAVALKRIPRDRPWWYYEQRHQAGRDLDVRVDTVPGVYPLALGGFPSGHTTTTVAMAAVVTILFRRRRWLVGAVWLAAIVVAFSRIYLGSHWPLDILGGAALGAVSGAASVWLCRMWAHPPGVRRSGAEGIG